jgi:hypothetical protein
MLTYPSWSTDETANKPQAEADKAEANTKLQAKADKAAANNKPQAKVKPQVRPIAKPRPTKPNQPAAYENVYMNQAGPKLDMTPAPDNSPSQPAGAAANGAEKKPTSAGKKPEVAKKPETKAEADPEPDDYPEDDEEVEYANDAAFKDEPTVFPLAPLPEVVVDKMKKGTLLAEFAVSLMVTLCTPYINYIYFQAVQSCWGKLCGGVG